MIQIKKIEKKKRKEVPRLSPILEKILKLANLVSGKVNLPNLYSLSQQTVPASQESVKDAVPSNTLEKAQNWDEDFPEHHQFVEKIKEAMPDYPNLFRDLHTVFGEISGCVQSTMLLGSLSDDFDPVIRTEFNPKDYFSQYYDYKEFEKIRSELAYIVLGVEAIMKQSNNRDRANLFLSDRTFNTRLFLSKEGKYDHKLDYLELALKKVNWDRIRLCEQCRQFFWVTRIDKSGCSARCCSSIRTRRKLQKNAVRFPSRVTRG